MRLYFLRHAEAGEAAADAERELTAKGRRDARRIGRYLKATEVVFDRAYTSPLVRARQTAEEVLAGCPLRGKAKLETTGVLLNETSSTEFLRWLASQPEAETLLFVGHEPSLSGHVRRLLGLTRAESLPLSKGAVARIDTGDRRTGLLKLLVTPKQIP